MFYFILKNKITFLTIGLIFLFLIIFATDIKNYFSINRDSGSPLNSSQVKDAIKIADKFIENDESFVIEKEKFSVSQKLPCSFCYFLQDGRFFGSQNGVIYFWSGLGELIWKKEMHVHHDVYFDEEQEIIYLVSGEIDRKHGKKKPKRTDKIIGINYSGEEVFSWRLKDNLSQLGSILGKKIELHENEYFFEYTHFNSVQALPETKLGKINKAFKKGNILVNDFWNYFAFIIDRETKQIVWHTGDYPKQLQIHSLRLLNSGEMVFFRNSNYGVDPLLDRSSVDFMDPITGKITHSIVLEPKEEFTSKKWGSLQVIDENRFLVTYSETGLAVEIDRTGNIFWKWQNLEKENGKPKPIYRVGIVNAEGFLKSMFMKKVNP